MSGIEQSIQGIGVAANAPSAPAASARRGYGHGLSSRLRRLLEASRIPGILSAFADIVEPTIARLFARRQWLVVEREDGDMAFHKKSGSRVTFFADVKTMSDTQRQTIASRRARGLELRLRADSVIHSTLKLPAGSAKYVEEIIQHRLDRLTPWKPDKVLYGFSIGPKVDPSGDIDIGFSATSLEIAADSVRRLEMFGVAPSSLGSAAQPIGQSLDIDLFRGRNDVARSFRRRRIKIAALAILGLAAAGLAVSTWLAFRSEAAIADLDARLSQARRVLIAGTGDAASRQQDLVLIAAKKPPARCFS